MAAGTVIAQVLLELMNLSLQSMKQAQIIARAHAEGRDISDEELASLDSEREELMTKWRDFVANLKASKTEE